jgi:hypothetical protein
MAELALAEENGTTRADLGSRFDWFGRCRRTWRGAISSGEIKVFLDTRDEMTVGWAGSFDEVEELLWGIRVFARPLLSGKTD